MYVDLTNMNSGFCDRLRQLTFCIAFEKLQNKKINLINIYEKKNSECPYYISELIDIKGCKLKNIKKKNIQTIRMDPFNSDISIANCVKYNSKKLDNIKLLKMWKKAYRMIQPKKKIMTRLKSIIKYREYVAIHIRLTDKLVSFRDYIFELPKKDVIYNNQFKEFLENVQLIIPKKYKYIYISSDESIYKNKIKKLFNNKYKFLDRKIAYNKNKLRQTSGDDFMIDLFSIAKSSLIISSTGGNVPYTSNLISGLNQNYIKWVNFKTKYKLINNLRKFIFFIRKLIN